MLNEIKTMYGAGEQLAKEVKKAEALIEKYGWQNMTIAPYQRAEPMMKYIGWMKEYDICTRGTKETLIAIWNGMARTLNAWERSELDATIRVRLLTGKHKGEERLLSPWMADLMLEEGAVELI